jgi:hypothetical protein
MEREKESLLRKILDTMGSAISEGWYTMKAADEMSPEVRQNYYEIMNRGSI